VERSQETPEGQPAGRKRWLLPMVLWTAGILLVLGLVWLVAAVVVPAYQAHEALSRAEIKSGLRTVGGVPYRQPMDEATMEALGGPERAAAKLDLYLRLPRVFTDRRGKAVRFLAGFGKPAIPGLTRALSDPDGNVRLFAAEGLGAMGPDAASAIPALEKMLQDEDKSLRRAAEEALAKIRGESSSPRKE
jgi:hypothetical protein